MKTRRIIALLLVLALVLAGAAVFANDDYEPSDYEKFSEARFFIQLLARKIAILCNYFNVRVVDDIPASEMFFGGIPQ